MAGSRSTTQTTNSQPWAAAQPAMKMALTDAQRLYRSGVGSQPYTGSTVVPYAQQTTQAMRNMQSGANMATPGFQSQFNAVRSNAGNGGLNALQNMSVAALKPMATGNPANNASQLNSVQRGALSGFQTMAKQNPVEGLGQLNNVQRRAYDLLNPIASGSQMKGNPYLDEVISRSSGDIAKSGNLMASAAGRYGSGGHQNVIADSVGDMSSDLRFSDYNNQLGRQDAAIRDIFGIGNQADSQYEADMGRKMGAMGAVNSIGQDANANYQAAMGRKMDATGSLFNAGQQQQGNINANTGAMSSAYQAMQAPNQTLMDLGGMNEDLYGRTLNDQLRMFSQRQNAPWDQLGRLNAIASGAGQMGSTGETIAQGPSRLQSGLGGALGGGTMFGPLGALGGGLLGAFG